jgi:hypothetical protein
MFAAAVVDGGGRATSIIESAGTTRSAPDFATTMTRTNEQKTQKSRNIEKWPFLINWFYTDLFQKRK